MKKQKLTDFKVQIKKGVFFSIVIQNSPFSAIFKVKYKNQICSEKAIPMYSTAYVVCIQIYNLHFVQMEHTIFHTHTHKSI